MPGPTIQPLRRKILAVAVVPTVLLVVAFLAVFAVQRRRISGEVEQSVTRLAEENLARAARDVRTLCDATHQDLSAQVPRSLSVARDELRRLGQLAFSRETVRWIARNQLDGTTTALELPKVLLGGAWPGQNASYATPTLLVDRVRELIGAEATLFQRMNARGDMLRVATTVPDGHGGRAIGTYIPAVDPDGRPNPVVATVLRGDTYRGRARVVNDWYLSGYEPLRDGSGAVVGMLFVGLRQESLDGIRNGVAASRIGRTGAMYVVGGSGNQRGRWLIPPAGEPEGADAGGERGSAASHVEAIVRAALAAPRGDTVLLSYGGGSGRPERLAAAAYFEPWDWVIVAEMDRDEAVASLRAIRSSMETAVITVFGVAVVLLLATVWVARAAAARIAAPLESMATAAERIARGDLRQELTYHSGDEVGRLADAFRGTIGYLQEVARAAAALARGDLSTPLAPRSDQDELTRSFQAAQAELRHVAGEMNRLTRSAVEGRLGARADASVHHGEYRKIVEGVNATIGTLVRHLDAMPAPAMIIGRDFEIRYLNQTGATLVGRTPREVVGAKCHDVFRMADCRTERCACARAMRDDREVSSETDAHPEGLDLHVLYSGVPLHDEAGRVIGALEVIADQTAMRCAAASPPDEAGSTAT